MKQTYKEKIHKTYTGRFMEHTCTGRFMRIHIQVDSSKYTCTGRFIKHTFTQCT